MFKPTILIGAKTLFVISVVLLANTTFASEYQQVVNAAIRGHNEIKLFNVTVQACKNTCSSKSWCRSFDYYKKERKCDLSKANYRDTGLKSDYPGNPYDHYSKIIRLSSYRHIKNSAISGHNTKKLTNVSVQACKIACTYTSWCRSFDYYKKERKCDLSKANYRATGLKSDYPGNPYDHYSKQ